MKKISNLQKSLIVLVIILICIIAVLLQRNPIRIQMSVGPSPVAVSSSESGDTGSGSGIALDFEEAEEEPVPDQAPEDEQVRKSDLGIGLDPFIGNFNTMIYNRGLSYNFDDLAPFDAGTYVPEDHESFRSFLDPDLIFYGESDANRNLTYITVLSRGEGDELSRTSKIVGMIQIIQAVAPEMSPSELDTILNDLGLYDEVFPVDPINYSYTSSSGLEFLLTGGGSEMLSLSISPSKDPV
ncbi:hypothetical protein C2I18_03275 [Paenibacillus sp. PK3_47]|uniref:hypothetical protein n=1 Tax=Paenibacillus sp. PK3_47 TaxID=2072642 RepID=UPI00201D623A|nr:hypothetical protein [Paenibacillus sp. PK3_47]UQZ32664.1 hypothetical protein C2I18_03275 [Paenibacillus sp. PK3_47]